MFTEIECPFPHLEDTGEPVPLPFHPTDFPCGEGTLASDHVHLDRAVHWACRQAYRQGLPDSAQKPAEQAEDINSGTGTDA